jgi:hypothetical protein
MIGTLYDIPARSPSMDSLKNSVIMGLRVEVVEAQFSLDWLDAS